MLVDKQCVIQWLRTAEGHLHAVAQMLEDEQPCPQILQKLNAVQCALQTTGSQLLSLEIHRCAQMIQDDPCPERQGDQLVHLVDLYLLASRYPVKS